MLSSIYPSIYSSSHVEKSSLEKSTCFFLLNASYTCQHVFFFNFLFQSRTSSLSVFGDLYSPFVPLFSLSRDHYRYSWPARFTIALIALTSLSTLCIDQVIDVLAHVPRGAAVRRVLLIRRGRTKDGQVRPRRSPKEAANNAARR